MLITIQGLQHQETAANLMAASVLVGSQSPTSLRISARVGHRSIRTSIGKQQPHVLKALKLQEYVKIIKQHGKRFQKSLSTSSN